ncbi:G2/mitotic-specific cyclin-B2 [Hypsibius exemplaris]|uniref:G2/mitotic-specific cyclin-B2 n=1 Tax=Hypsibius exemplaris TaxID=2072580 RepID=A0A1W0WWF5_HYPEX|nr:G2/mitotic-specific cyclin-B2 [Hypsibius exemplaris]
MASLANRVNQGPAVQPSGMINKPNVQQKLPTLPATLLPSTVVARERDSKAAAAQILRTKRIRIAQDHVVRTAGKENGCPPGFKGRPEHITDIYQGDDTSEALVVAYVEHIYSYLHFREETRLKQNYMDEMSVNGRMRAILMDWLVSVAYKFHMCQDTLFLAVDITDRFLATPEIDVTKDELQLVGVTAMFIASKFEEVYPPELDDFVYIADNSCTKEQILEAEMMITNQLNFDFTRPSPVHFLRRICKAAGASTEEYCMAKYICELSILDITFVAVVPSMTAAAAMYLTLKYYPRELTPHLPFWNADMQYYSGHAEQEIIPIATMLLESIKIAPKVKHQCIYKKYGSKMYFVADKATKYAGSIVL